MCGIVGMVGAPGAPAPSLDRLRTAVSVLRHRGPDGDGTFAEGRVALGHTRLSIIDVEGGAQPLANEDGSVVTVFNGEIWNHMALRRELEKRGHVFRTRSDTEAIVHGYEEWGDELVHHLHGMFAFAVWDSKEERTLLARDPVGKKPLYSMENEHGLHFASDVRALLLMAGQQPELDADGVTAILFQRYTVSPRTAFRGVERLPPGHVLSYDGRRSLLQQYWAPRPPERPEALRPQELRSLLREAVRARLMSDVPLGVLLSGGVDSCAVLGLAREATESRIDTFTIGFADTTFDERPLARLAASRANTNHHEVVVDGHAFHSALGRLAWYRDEPIAEPSEIPLLLLSEFAAKNVKVVLTGDAGDELFGGYPKYRAERIMRAMGPIARPGRAVGRRLSSQRTTHRRLDRAFGTLAVHDELLRWASWFRSFGPREISALLIDDSTARVDRLTEPLRALIEPVSNLDSGRRMLLGDFLTYLPDNMLLRTDKVLMAASIEGRVPLLDRTVVERVSATPLGDRIGWRTGKTLLRAAVADLVPHEVLSAPKRGFPVPVAQLLAEGDNRRLERMLVSERALSRGLFKPEAIRELVSGNSAGESQRDLQVFTLISLELWLRSNVDHLSLTPPASTEELLADCED